jgi:hypothetical protein
VSLKPRDDSRMPIYEPVARYHVSRSNSPDFSDDDIDDDVGSDERQSFISYRGAGSRRIPASHGKTLPLKTSQEIM